MRAQRPVPLPPDVRLMNATSWLVVLMAVGVLLAASVAWVARQPAFGIRGIRLEGDLSRNSEATIRANAAPRLAGSFFTMDLQVARAAFESVPWVRHVVVRRVWPGWLVVRVEEHQPAARWVDDSGNQLLVNSQGEIFNADEDDLSDAERQWLPVFSGRASAAPAMLRLYGRLNQVLRPLDSRVVQLRQSDRGLWELTLDNGKELVLGRGSDDEVLAHLGMFVRTIASVAAQRRMEWDRADLRHPQGYAVRFPKAAATKARN